jgi:hypothetical protein
MKLYLLPFIVLLALPAYAVEKGFQALFNGKNLDGWVLFGGKGPGYVAKDGILICPADGGGNLLTEQDYSDFVFRFEFKLSDGGNNGVGIRAPLAGDIAYSGMEIQILDHDAPVYQGKLKPAQYHGSIYDVVPAKTGFLKETGEWNQEEITAIGRKIKVVLNGTTIVDADLDAITDPAVLKKHPGLARTTGRIGFLGHGTKVDFRNIRIKPLTTSESPQ